MVLSLEDTGFVPLVGGLWAGAVEMMPGLWVHFWLMLLEDVRAGLRRDLESGQGDEIEGRDGRESLESWSDLNEAGRRQLADMYGALHARGVLHGDVEPRHVFPQPDGSFKLIDFEGAVLRKEETEEAWRQEKWEETSALKCAGVLARDVTV